MKQIPEISSVAGWQSVPIHECHERLVPSSILHPSRILVSPHYYLSGIEGAVDDCYIRESVAEMLIRASMNLSCDYRLVILDAWRPISVQRSLFDGFKHKLAVENPSLNEDELIKIVLKYVSLPSTDPTKPSPHNTGGSVDVSIIGPTGDFLDMGTGFDNFTPRASTRYFEGNGCSTNVRDNRRLLYHVMTEAGFTNYDEEWWHYDYGTQFWGRITGRNALYGGLDSFK